MSFLVLILLIDVILLRIQSSITPSFQDRGMCAFAQIAAGIRTGWKCTSDLPITPVCSWSYVGCDSNGTVTTLLTDRVHYQKVPCGGTVVNSVAPVAYDSTVFYGTIPTEISYLTGLTLLQLIGHSLSNLPTYLGSLTRLSVVCLSSNIISGTIPSEIGRLFNLTHLDLSINKIVGTLPSSFYNLTNIKVLWINSNSIQDVVSIGFNKFTGTIPTEIQTLTDLFYLRLYNNKFHGTIPTEMGKLTQMKALQLGHGSLTGTIPTELGQLQLMYWLDLSYNSLAGTIPTALGNLTNLWVVSLSANSLTGAIPIELFKCSVLQNIELFSNSLTGHIPTEIAYLRNNLSSLNLGINRLSGTIPAQLTDLPFLESLVLATNSLNGSIPSRIGALTRLSYLDLSQNSLTRQVPMSIGEAKALNFLDIHANFFTGHIPPSICSLTNLATISICFIKTFGCPHLLGVPQCMTSLTAVQKYGDLTFYSNYSDYYTSSPTMVMTDSSKDSAAGFFSAGSSYALVCFLALFALGCTMFIGGVLLRKYWSESGCCPCGEVPEQPDDDTPNTLIPPVPFVVGDDVSIILRSETSSISTSVTLKREEYLRL